MAGLFTRLMLVTMGTITAVVAISVGFSNQNGQFWLSYLMMLFGTLVSFGYPLALAARNAPAGKNVPLQMVPGLLAGGYFVGVLILGIVGLSGEEQLKTLGVIHVLLAFLLFAGFGFTGVAGVMFSQMDEKDRRERMPTLLLVNRCRGLSERIETLPGDTDELASEWRHLCDEELAYVASESVAGAEEVDSELNACLDAIEQNVERLTNDEVEAKAGVTQSMVKFRQLLKRREALIAELRRA